MSVSFFITLFITLDWGTDLWETNKPSFHIDQIEYESGLRKNWRIESPDSDYTLFGDMMADFQGVSFGPSSKSLFNEFVLWNRIFIPEKYALYLSSTFTTDVIKLTASTTEETIQSFSGIIR